MPTLSEQSSSTRHGSDEKAASSSDRPPMSLAREIVFVSIICSAQLLTQAGLGQVIPPLHIIGKDLNASSAGVLSWYPAGYSLTVGSFILLSGRLGDLFGHKRFFIIGFLWFALWSLIGGTTRYTHSSKFFIMTKVFQGIGPALVLPNGLAILGRTYPPSKRKTRVFSIFGATAPSGFLIAAVFSSLFAQRVNWSWAFYLMAIVCAGIAFLAVFVLPRDEDNQQKESKARDGKRKPFTEILVELDLFASIIGITGLVLFNIAWNEAPNIGWNQAYIIVLLIVSVLLMVVFAFMEIRVSKYPLVPKEIFTKEISLILGCIAAGWASFGIWIYYGWLFFTLQRMKTPLLVSAYYSPITISGLLAGAAVAVLLHRVGPGWIMMAAMFAFMLGNLFLSIAPVSQTYWGLSFVGIAIAPFGMDMSFPAANVIISNFVTKDKQGNAASLVNTILNYSISIGLGIAGTVEVHLNRGGETQEDLLRGYRSAFRVGIGLASLGIFCALILLCLVSKKDEEATSTDSSSTEHEAKETNT